MQDKQDNNDEQKKEVETTLTPDTRSISLMLHRAMCRDILGNEIYTAIQTRYLATNFPGTPEDMDALSEHEQKTWIEKVAAFAEYRVEEIQAKFDTISKEREERIKNGEQDKVALETYEAIEEAMVMTYIYMRDLLGGGCTCPDCTCEKETTTKPKVDSE